METKRFSLAQRRPYVSSMTHSNYNPDDDTVEQRFEEIYPDYDDSLKSTLHVKYARKRKEKFTRKDQND